MADSNALRQRRYKAHRNNDHSLCLPANCDKAPGALSDYRVGAVGAQFLLDIDAAQLPAHVRTVALELARLVERAQRFEALLAGDEQTWLTLIPQALDGSVVKVVVGPVIGEARLTATAIRQLAQFLVDATPAEQAPSGRASVLQGIRDELASRRPGA
jgi:hypothetical protein